MTEERRVAILLATFNGEQYLASQLKTIECQTHENWCIHAADDGSTDGTLSILQDVARALGDCRLNVRKGPGQGFVTNFLSLVCARDINAEYFAFADQDDLWDTDKLERGLAALEGVPNDVPALYCARTRTVDAQGGLIGLSPLFLRPPSFRNALIQNLGAGNTMMFNSAARELLRNVGLVNVPAHDWWAYLVVSVYGGVIVYDAEPCLSYRQHGHNIIGHNRGMLQRLKRYGLALIGRNRRWSDQHLNALQPILDNCSAEQKAVYYKFSQYRNLPVLLRIRKMRRLGLYAQTRIGQFGLMLAIALKRI